MYLLSLNLRKNLKENEREKIVGSDLFLDSGNISGAVDEGCPKIICGRSEQEENRRRRKKRVGVVREEKKEKGKKRVDELQGRRRSRYERRRLW